MICCGHRNHGWVDGTLQGKQTVGGGEAPCRYGLWTASYHWRMQECHAACWLWLPIGCAVMGTAVKELEHALQAAVCAQALRHASVGQQQVAACCPEAPTAPQECPPGTSHGFQLLQHPATTSAPHTDQVHTAEFMLTLNKRRVLVCMRTNNALEASIHTCPCI